MPPIPHRVVVTPLRVVYEGPDNEARREVARLNHDLETRRGRDNLTRLRLMMLERALGIANNLLHKEHEAIMKLRVELEEAMRSVHLSERQQRIWRQLASERAD